MRRWLSIAAGVVIGGGLLYYAFRDVDFREVAQAFKRIRVVWLPLLAVIPLADLWFRAARWRLLLRPACETDVWTLYKLEGIGLAINNLLFLRMGEVARGVICGRRLGIPVPTALATIVVERMCDSAALLVIFLASAAMLPELFPAKVRLGAAACVAGLLAFLAVLSALAPRLEGELSRLDGYPRAQRFVRDVAKGSRALRSFGTAWRVVALSMGLWIMQTFTYWAAARAMGFEPSLSVLRSMAVLGVAAAGVAIPALPGGIGNFEAAIKLILVHFGYPQALAVSYGTFIHAGFYLIVTVVGVAFLYTLGQTFSGLRQAVEKQEARS